MSTITTSPFSRKEDLTIEELRSRKRFKNYSNEQLQNLLHTIKSFTRIVYGVWSKNCGASEEKKYSLQPNNISLTTPVLESSSKREAA